MPISRACAICPATALPTAAAPARVAASSAGVLRSTALSSNRKAATPVRIITTAAIRMAGMKARGRSSGVMVFVLIYARDIGGRPIEVQNGALDREQRMIGLLKQRGLLARDFGRQPLARQPLSERFQVPGG